MATLYETSDTCPPHPVTFAVNEYTAGVVGVPVRPSDVVELDAFALMPAGNVPDAIAHLYGVHPPIALIAAVYASRTVPFGRPFVVIDNAGWGQNDDLVRCLESTATAPGHLYGGRIRHCCPGDSAEV